MQFNEYERLHETKAHSSPLFPYNVYLCTIPLDFQQVPAHWHSDLELIVIKKGCGLVSVDMQWYAVQKKDIVLIRPGQIHAIKQQPGEAMEYENILFAPAWLYAQRADRCTLDYFEPYFDLTYDLPCHITPAAAVHRDLYACIERIDVLCDARQRYYELSVKANLFQFFYLVFSAQGGQIPAKKRTNLEKVKEVLTFIEQNYALPITVDETATEVGFSTSHFMKFFKQHMNTTFTAYLTEYRLVAAAQLLLTSEDSILQIAESVGFNNLSYFNRQFKAQFDMTPSGYRTAARAKPL